MQTVKIVCLALAMTGLHAKETQWQNLKSLYRYSSSDFSLDETIAVMEIRCYGTYSNFQKYNKPTLKMKFHKTPSKLLDAKLVKRFENSTPNLSKNGNIHRTSKSSPDITNAFVIDNHGKIWRMNEIADVIGFMGEIDTPAEAQLILWLNAKQEGKKYRKTSKGYEILIKYGKSYPSDKGDKSIGEFCNEIREVTDKAVVDKKGKIVSYKQVDIAKKGLLDCLHPSPPMHPILKEK